MSEPCEQALQPRGRFQFDLRTMFAAVAILALALGWQLRVVQQRRALRASFVVRGGRLTRNACPNWMGRPTGRPELFPKWREWLGDRQVDDIEIRAAQYFCEADLDEARRLFPEAVLHIVPSPQEPAEQTASASP